MPEPLCPQRCGRAPLPLQMRTNPLSTLETCRRAGAQQGNIVCSHSLSQSTRFSPRPSGRCSRSCWRSQPCAGAKRLLAAPSLRHAQRRFSGTHHHLRVRWGAEPGGGAGGLPSIPPCISLPLQVISGPVADGALGAAGERGSAEQWVPSPSPDPPVQSWRRNPPRPRDTGFNVEKNPQILSICLDLGISFSRVSWLGFQSHGCSEKPSGERSPQRGAEARAAGAGVCVGAACLGVGPAAAGAGLEWKLWLTGQRPPSCHADDKCTVRPGHLPAGRSRHVTGEKIAMSESNRDHRCCCRGVNRNISISVPSGGKDAWAGCSAGGQRRRQIHPRSRTWRGAPWCSPSPCSGLRCLSRGCGAGAARGLGPACCLWEPGGKASAFRLVSPDPARSAHGTTLGPLALAVLLRMLRTGAAGAAGGCGSLLPHAGSKAKSSFLACISTRINSAYFHPGNPSLVSPSSCQH